MFLQLFRPSENSQLTRKKLLSLLKPNFAEAGSNERSYQDTIYRKFVKYATEAAGKYKYISNLKCKVCSFVFLTYSIEATEILSLNPRL